MNRVYNFSAGPSALPEDVLQKAADEMLNYNDTGMSVMEMSHRSADFKDILTKAKDDLRELMNIPEDYEILFLQGGASTQFAAIPLNFMNGSGKADYIITGQWAKKAFEEAKKYGDVVEAASSADKNYTYIPITDRNSFREDADYVYVTGNNTIYGTRFRPESYPDTGDIPLFADISSSILSEPIDVSKFGLLYAGAQKNMGPAGVTVVIVRKDLLGKQRDITPTMLNYKIMADNDSLYNTPPTYGIYVLGLVLEHLKELGGIEAMKELNEKKAGLLYDYLDHSKLFKGTVVPKDRSLMNVPFVIGDKDLEEEFVKKAEKRGLVNLKGHRTVGGMRASIYNAMPLEGVKALVDFMKEFEEEHVQGTDTK